jgi:PIN domain nuclease of toxin-antitoxin system
VTAYVLDTHALLLASFQTWALSKLVQAVIELGQDYSAELIVPAMALAEALQQIRRYARGRYTAEQFLEQIEATDYLTIEPMGYEHVRLLPRLAGIREMHDRMIAAHAVYRTALLITPDHNIRESGLVETVW